MVKPLVIALLVIVPACSKTKKEPKPEPVVAKDAAPAPAPAPDADTACPARTVTVDGQPIAGLDFSQAVTIINGEFTIHMVNVYNHDVPCSDALGNHPGTEGEIQVRAWFSAMSGVGIDAYTEVPLHPKIDVTKDPKVVGEPFEICVREPITFTPNAGLYEGKKVSIGGTFTGPWCGERKE